MKLYVYIVFLQVVNVNVFQNVFDILWSDGLNSPNYDNVDL